MATPRLRILAAALLMAFVPVGAGVQANPASLGRSIEIGGEASFIFTFAPEFRGKVADAAQAAARSVGGRVTHVYDGAIKGFAATLKEGAARSVMGANRSLIRMERDLVVTTMATRTGVSTRLTDYQGMPWGTLRVGTCVAPCYSRYARVWVIDTGIAAHSDLNIDWRNGFDAFGGKPIDRNGHGTHVAGTIGAKDNDIGTVGVAPGVRVVPVRVLDADGYGTLSTVLAGIDHVVKRKKRCVQLNLPCTRKEAWVVNMSLGSTANSTVDRAVINASKMGIRFAIAAGNESRRAKLFSPGRANAPNIFTVSASDANDRLPGFSNFGNGPVDIAAPGLGVVSTFLGGGYATYSGTSMAAPHVAGILVRKPKMRSDRTFRTCGRLKYDRDANPDRIAWGRAGTVCTQVLGTQSWRTGM